MAAARTQSRWLILVVLAMAFFTWTEVAWAQIPDDIAAVDQYRETIPTGGGGTGVGTGPGTDGGTGTPLPAATRAALYREAGDLAPVLEAIATSPALGAPTISLESSGRGVRPDDDGATLGSLEPSPASAAVGAVTGDGASRIVGLLVVLFAISALAVGAATVRQRV
jgi:hypothetical protein